MPLSTPIQEDLCFVIMPLGGRGEYGPEGESGEAISLQVFTIIKGSIDEASRHLRIGLRCERADVPATRGSINKRIYEMLDQARIVVADLTGANPNVHYELGVRLSVRRNGTVVITRDRSQVAFDLGQLRIEQYQTSRSEELKRFLITQVEDIITSAEPHQIDSPVYEFLPHRESAAIAPPIERFWSPFTTARTRIILGQHGALRAETTGVMGTGDALALVRVARMLSQLGVEPELTLSPQRPSSWEDNLIYIGGPGTNNSLITVQRKLDPDIWFGPSEDPDHAREPVLYNRISGEEYRPERDERKDVAEDFGLIIYSTNPYNPDRSILVLAGVWGSGSDGAARAVVVETSIVKEILEAGNSQSVVKVPVVDRKAGRPEKVVIERLNIDSRRLVQASPPPAESSGMG